MELILKEKKYFWFSQNNSGGSFDRDQERGIDCEVIVEAESAEDANRRAEAIGIYFNGCDSGQDCSCCGDRWYQQWDSEGDPVPSLHGTSVYAATATSYRERAFIHYVNGLIEEVDFSHNGIDVDDVSDDTPAAGNGNRHGAARAKLRKILALAKDQAGTPEGAAAQQVATEFAAKHNIELTVVA